MAGSDLMLKSKCQTKASFNQLTLLRPFILFAIFATPLAWAQEGTSEQKNVPSNKYRPCILGPQLLISTNEWEHQNRKKALVTINGKSMTPEIAAEMFISDCSKQLAIVSGMAALDEGTAFKMVRNMWNENLEFMKWWLQNRRQKVKSPVYEK